MTGFTSIVSDYWSTVMVDGYIAAVERCLKVMSDHYLSLESDSLSPSVQVMVGD